MMVTLSAQVGHAGHKCHSKRVHMLAPRTTKYCLGLFYPQPNLHERCSCFLWCPLHPTISSAMVIPVPLQSEDGGHEHKHCWRGLRGSFLGLVDNQMLPPAPV